MTRGRPSPLESTVLELAPYRSRAVQGRVLRWRGQAPPKMTTDSERRLANLLQTSSWFGLHSRVAPWQNAAVYNRRRRRTNSLSRVSFVGCSPTYITFSSQGWCCCQPVCGDTVHPAPTLTKRDATAVRAWCSYCDCVLWLCIGTQGSQQTQQREQKLAHAEAFFGCCLTKLLKVL